MKWIQFLVGFTMIPVVLSVIFVIPYMAGFGPGAAQPFYLGLFTFLGIFILVVVAMTAWGII